MKDIRISIRLTSEQHQKFKILAVQQKTTMQEILLNYIIKETKGLGCANEKQN